MNRFTQIKTNLKVKVEEEDQSDDFSREEPSVHIGPWVEQEFDKAAFEERVVAAVSQLKVGDGRDPETNVGPLFDANLSIITLVIILACLP